MKKVYNKVLRAASNGLLTEMWAIILTILFYAFLCQLVVLEDFAVVFVEIVEVPVVAVVVNGKCKITPRQ